ncbi:flagellar hook protein FlgE [Bradyrhizobium sp. USDA 4524]|uniref:flagellar hook-basal body complex protein n=1 Tax=unclassified Bradyrhizobium TaxID=2631580 RepID=UPI00209FF95C|nr:MULTISPECIES: flagellar hook-basal body complex protein [unclassified Bradyrhizobium]MCP1843201.1 flagellar hook protein FlgE [Bradyrhizobium sp. USDA 4538]MCP1903767.1 flagellar hook protein FlgE [Bradyrhizobium sp. USDA 4537]MCP1990577.1 flagellar hook protein FlgE [Bradyrhizobium sp. USDA 4539]
MGIFGALTTAVGGLRAGSYALENISGNIANSQTTAFKRIDTSFLDLVPQTALTAQLAGGVTAQSRSTNSVQGDVQSASVATFMAINGNGFFAVQKPGSFTDGAPVFDGVDRYTRRGDFQLNKDGYLVNGAGYYLEGVPIDPTTGNPAGSSPQVLQFKNDFLPAQQTTKIDYRANLASYPLTTAHDTSVPGSELIRPGAFSSGNNPLVLGTPAAPYTDSAITGTAQNNKATPSVAITAATLLSGAAGTDSINTNFSAGSAGPPVVPADTITVNGTVITFVASGATGNQLNVTDSIGTLLAKIDAITGTTTPSTISGGKITLHSGKLADLNVTSSNSTAFAALGFTGSAVAVRGGGGTVGTGQVIGNDNSTFLNESVSGGAVTAYDVSGAPVNLQFRWAKTDSSSLGGTHTDTWNLFYQVNPNATGTQVSWQNVNVNFTFASNGQMSPAISSVALTNAVVNGVSLGSPVINFGSGGVTQFADANGNVQVNQIQQDGFPAGQLQSVSVSTNGRIVGNYTNGRNIDLAEISVATFNGTNFLKRIDGGAFEATDESGAALFGKAGTIVGSSLESSNTDIADEFTKLIVTQQAYSANTKVITTTNSMVQDLLNVVR